MSCFCNVRMSLSRRFDERRSISRMLDQKFSQSEIARRLGRDRATISREIKRNYWHDQEFPATGR
ncbi:hypothetical protein EMEDMD4_1040035 [Sinorhizobium medicae]|uniref:Transposase IS30-like HTH domain-containing protein n=1 Tax=Sinorhizobium medicae TaxID=110321 RepID=A0A508WNY8_9HYPH|nr:hypothetical protein EMEDMD4_1040035 [Sinorhizobium medicae]